jgi:hypothetical protein
LLGLARTADRRRDEFTPCGLEPLAADRFDGLPSSKRMEK